MNAATKRRIRRFLKTQEKSQNWLARELGISHAYLSQILSGLRTPSLDVAARLERLTGVPAKDFAEVA